MNTNTASSDFNFDSLNDFINAMNREGDRARNPNGTNKQVVRLENFRPGQLRIYKQVFPGIKPIEASRTSFQEGQNRLSLDSDFIMSLEKGLSVRSPFDIRKN